jgi:putative sigma-54 modulation protein
MDLIIKGRNAEVSDYLRQYVEKKISKLDRYLPTITEARVELSSENTKTVGEVQIAQVTLRAERTILRGEERSSDVFAAVDAVVDTLYRQIARYKGKRQDRWRGRGEPLLTAEETLAELVEEPIGPVVRRKRFQVLPMNEDEAIEQMELLGHDFFIFHNAESGEMNVVYRRRDGGYGILQPVMA